MLEHDPDQAGMFVLTGLAKIGRLADFPQTDQIGAVAAAADDDLVRSQLAQGGLVLAFL